MASTLLFIAVVLVGGYFVFGMDDDWNNPRKW